MVALTIGMSEVFYQSMMRSTTQRCWDEIAMARNETSREIGEGFNSNLRMLELASDAIFMNADVEDEDTMRAYLAAVKAETIFDRIDVVFPDGTILVQSTGERLEDN